MRLPIPSVLAICFALLAVRRLPAQDAPVFDQTDLSLLAAVEARFRLGGTRGDWEVRGAQFYQRDDNWDRYASSFTAIEVLRHTEKIGYFSLQGFYLSLAEARAGAIYRFEWQKTWTDRRLAPLIRFTQERVHVSERGTNRRLLTNYPTRLRAGIVPPLSPRLRAIALFEWFPYQTYGFSTEYRSILGVSYELTSAVRVVIAHLGRMNDYAEATHRYQHTALVVFTYSGVVSKHPNPVWEGGDR